MKKRETRGIKRLPSKIKLDVLGTTLGILGVGLAAYFYYYPKGEPDLYISLSTGKETVWTFNPENPVHRSIEEEVVFQADIPDSPDKIIYLRDPTVEFSGPLVAEFYILNMGNWNAKGVWVKIFFDATTNLRVLGDVRWNTGYNESKKQYVAYFDGVDFDIAKETIQHSLGVLALNLPPIPRTYRFPYIIGAKGIKPRERSLSFRVDTINVPAAYIANARGLESIRDGNLRDALDHFQYAVQKMPRVAGFQYNLGDTLRLLGKFNEAEKPILLATQLDPDSPLVWTNLGVIYMEQLRWKMALKAIDRALALDPRNSKNLKWRSLLIKLIESLEQND